ncbi:RTA1 like protein-domain-containing protein [Lipomyces chichibuensis]|uniref:RTA1 like protein-domain-containing protein n=1 Tax=Lipomyces chichibuensis TaxID=1546026 RepID=UPI003343EA9D
MSSDYLSSNSSTHYNDNYNVYGYTPLRAPNLAALIVFGAAWAAHASLAVFYQQIWFGVCLFIAAGLETAGYIGRFLSSSDPTILNDFLVQIICLTLGPAFYMAGTYYLLAEIVVIWGVENSRLLPWTYSKVFISLDLVSIALQALGGGMAATALVKNKNVNTGTHIMVAGLAFQVFATSVFVLCWLDFFWTRRNRRTLGILSDLPQGNDMSGASETANLDGPEKFAHIRNAKKTKLFLLALGVSIIFVFVRSIYRVAELSLGWKGYLMRQEGYFLVLDCLMVAIAFWIMVAFYPGYFLGRIHISAEHAIAKSSSMPDQEEELKHKV